MRNYETKRTSAGWRFEWKKRSVRVREQVEIIEERKKERKEKTKINIKRDEKSWKSERNKPSGNTARQTDRETSISSFYGAQYIPPYTCTK